MRTKQIRFRANRREADLVDRIAERLEMNRSEALRYAVEKTADTLEIPSKAGNTSEVSDRKVSNAHDG